MATLPAGRDPGASGAATAAACDRASAGRSGARAAEDAPRGSTGAEAAWGWGTGRGCGSCQVQWPGTGQPSSMGQDGSGTAGPGSTAPSCGCLKPDTKVQPGKSDGGGLSQSHVPEPTGMRGCLQPPRRKPSPCPSDSRGSCTVPAAFCCSPRCRPGATSRVAPSLPRREAEGARSSAGVSPAARRLCCGMRAPRVQEVDSPS